NQRRHYFCPPTTAAPVTTTAAPSTTTTAIPASTTAAPVTTTVAPATTTAAPSPPVDVLAILRADASQSSTAPANNNYNQLSAFETMVTVTDSSKPTMNGRRLGEASSTDLTLNLMFCNAKSNGLVSYTSQKPVSSSSYSTVFGTKEPDVEGKCYDYSVKVDTISVAAGCNAQNSPQGCGDVLNPGCGGLSVDPLTKQIYVARTGGRTIGKLHYVTASNTCDGRVLDWLVRYHGKKFNGPADVTFTSTGNLYFTDSPFALASSIDQLLSPNLTVLDAKRDLSFNGVFVRPVRGNGTQVIDANMTRPRGIAFSPEEDVLYVANADASAPYVKAFQLFANGTTNCARTFFDFSTHVTKDTTPCLRPYPTSVQVDSDGFVYVAMCHSIFVLNAAGTLLGRIDADAAITSITLSTGHMFINAQSDIYAVAMDSAFGNAQPTVANPQTSCDVVTAGQVKTASLASSDAAASSTSTSSFAVVGSVAAALVIAVAMYVKLNKKPKNDAYAPPASPASNASIAAVEGHSFVQQAQGLAYAAATTPTFYPKSHAI
ncbi:hypothetical protein As57867_006039, partial [Aphanomyces stellatus]